MSNVAIQGPEARRVIAATTATALATLGTLLGITGAYLTVALVQVGLPEPHSPGFSGPAEERCLCAVEPATRRVAG